MKYKIKNFIKKSFFLFFLIFFLIFFLNFILNKNLNIYKKKYSLNNIASFSNYKNLNKINIKTNVFLLNINLEDGNIKNVHLLKYFKKRNSFKNLKILKENKKNLYKIENGLIQKNNINKIYPIYKNYKIFKKKNNIIIKLIHEDKNIKVIKIFKFKKSSYKINIKYKIINKSDKRIKISFFNKIKKKFDKNKINKKKFILNKLIYLCYSNNKNFKKITINNILNKNHINIKNINGWISISNKYFATAIIPNLNEKFNIYTKDKNNILTFGLKSKYFDIKPNNSKDFNYSIWIGPKIDDLLTKVAPNFNLILNYGYLFFISKYLYFLLKVIFSKINNWGFSIIILTLLLKILTLPITNLQYKNLNKINNLKPIIKKLKIKYKDTSILNKKIMILYKKNNINPLNNFFPILVQMPIFFSMYYVLINNIELRHSNFILWIKDLSHKDPYYILPILMIIINYINQRTSYEENNKFINLLSLIFSIIFIYFPSSLLIYYITNNLFITIQQYYINKK